MRICFAQETAVPPTNPATVEDPFMKSWTFGWGAGLLPVPPEIVAELGLSNDQKAQVQRIIERIQAKRDTNVG
jgi:hypothetical protein